MWVQQIKGWMSDIIRFIITLIISLSNVYSSLTLSIYCPFINRDKSPPIYDNLLCILIWIQIQIKILICKKILRIQYQPLINKKQCKVKPPKFSGATANILKKILEVLLSTSHDEKQQELSGSRVHELLCMGNNIMN